jgi:hypothetical protein
LPCRMISCPAAKGIRPSKEVPRAIDLPGVTNRVTASDKDMIFDSDEDMIAFPFLFKKFNHKYGIRFKSNKKKRGKKY